MWLFKKKTCKLCKDHVVTSTKHFGYWVLACANKNEPIYAAKLANEIDYKTPKWCPRR